MLQEFSLDERCTASYIIFSPRSKHRFRGGFGEAEGATRGLRSGLPRQSTPQGQNPVRANEEENNAVLRLSFPRKLWMMVEDVDFISVHWDDEGDTVVIRADLF